MDHEFERIIPGPGNIWKFGFYNFLISWKYWKSDFSNFSYPGNTGKWIFFNFSYPGNTGNQFFPFLLSWKHWRLKSPLFPGSWKYGRRAGGSRGCVVLPWIIFGTCSWKNEHGNLGIKVKTNTFFKIDFQAKPLCS